MLSTNTENCGSTKQYKLTVFTKHAYSAAATSCVAAAINVRPPDLRSEIVLANILTSRARVACISVTRCRTLFRDVLTTVATHLRATMLI